MKTKKVRPVLRGSKQVEINSDTKKQEKARNKILEAVLKLAEDIPKEYHHLFLKYSKIEVTLIDEHAVDDDTYLHSGIIVL